MEYGLNPAVFGGGCFWCTEAVFSALKGVTAVVPGYAGGQARPDGPPLTYEEVSTGRTGYAEMVKIDYDPAIISYRDLLTVFFATHNPTTLNRQDSDVGTQYRSVIFYATPDQKAVAESFVEELNAANVWRKKIVTEIKPFEQWLEAEAYHRRYYEKNPDQAYCRWVIRPKLVKLQEAYAHLLRRV